ncbi:FMN-dependent NADH-azoreductase [Bordetella tumulicola]|uniref:FMN-dependent NADH-azoreductase n=1 Tax=Bordetella tumulicola TaxID=1649133 RepID=UPI0039F02963
MNVLHIDCSPRTTSYSRQLSAAMVTRLISNHPGAQITRRDLGHEPVPHTDSDYATALSTADALASGLANGATQRSEQLIQELESAHALVIGTPMNNFTVPSTLKAWIDQIVRVGRTFAPSPNGEKIGLLQDRPVYIGIASGGFFTGEKAKQPDFLTPYLAAILGCVGIKKLQFLALQGTAFLDPSQLATQQGILLDTLRTGV